MLRNDKWYEENESKEGQYKKAEGMGRGMGRFLFYKGGHRVSIVKKF